MIPIRLEIQGLYSYREKQVIDFQQLVGAGLFGIFGAVGSGKSSVLEAILLALYGSTERLSDRGEKNSMLNLQSNQLLINFEFRGGKNNGQTYLARYATKRNTKNFDEVRPAEHTFYEVLDGKPVALEERAESILGMKKEHFKQTVIIPQGKFREFIDLTPGPRADMMKELFGLERFDLSAKTSGLLKSVREDKIRLETQLAAFSSVTKESIDEQEAHLEQAGLLMKEAEERSKETEAAFRLQEGYEKSFRTLEAFREEWGTIESKKPEIENQKKINQEYLRAKTYLKPIWDSIQELSQEQEKFQVSVLNCGRFKEEYRLDVQTLQEEEKILKEKAELRPEREAKIRDLRKVIEIRQLVASLELAQHQLESLQPEIQLRDSELKRIESETKTIGASVAGMPTVDVNQLAGWKSAEKEWTQWEAVQAKLLTEIQELQTKERQLESSVQAMRKELPSDTGDMEVWLTVQRDRIRQLEGEKEVLMDRRGLATHAHLLVDGKPCPLCGALDHPHPLAPNEEAELLELINKRIQKAREEESGVLEISQRLKEEHIRLEHQQVLASSKIEEAKEAREKLDSLVQAFALINVQSIEMLSGLIEETEKQVMERERLLASLNDLRAKGDRFRGILEVEREKLNVIHQQTLSLGSAMEAKKGEIVDPGFCAPFYSKGVEAIQDMIQKVGKDIEDTALRLEGKRKVLQETRTKEATNLADLRNFQALLETTSVKLGQQLEAFKKAMFQYGFSGEDEVKALFRHSLDTDAVEAAIRRFEDRRLVVKAKIEELEAEAGVASFRPGDFHVLRGKLEQARTAWANRQQEFTLLTQQVKENKARLEEKGRLEKAYGELAVREGHLRELDILFRGSGFVRYVSSIYLKELCNTANLRFRKLTKNSLSMEIDDNNTFWVVDYLNGGRKRLLKSLSGGQTFQACLCLALALAEKVKTLNQADQSFFFLDEGFGALDRTSLRVVFETLKSLRHENRVVGIISHVEELQQEIEVYAKVSLNPEKGSQVSYSYI